MFGQMGDRARGAVPALLAVLLGYRFVVARMNSQPQTAPKIAPRG